MEFKRVALKTLKGISDLGCYRILRLTRKP
jgi:hypothetical protein